MSLEASALELAMEVLFSIMSGNLDAVINLIRFA
jgi:hypothetical protein